MSLEDCAEMVKDVFLIDSVRIFGDPSKRIRKAAISPGSGKGMSRYAISAGADVLITGDIGHHDGIDAVAQGLAVIDAGHWGIEKIFCSYMKDFMRKEIPELTVNIASQTPPFIVV
jgi:putative NIF3 family GTP cyclohydrolase 1 type 2